MAELRLQDVSFRYPGSANDTLDQLTLQIGSGEAHALLGGSGAGKTTLLNLLSGLLAPTAGTLLLAGQPLADKPPAARGVSQVFQFPVLYEALSLLDNLGFPLRAQGIKKRARDERARWVAGMLEFESNGLAELAMRKPGSLSLYQKQLLAIGKALVRSDLKLVLLDEPLTAVQPSLKWSLRRTLRQVQKELGVTMIYVTHDQTEALTFADRVSVLHDGRILQSETPEQLYLRPAHPYVGFFIGSPGMNFLEAEVIRGSIAAAGERWSPPADELSGIAEGPIQLGFRPEWAVLDDLLTAEHRLSFDAMVLGARTTGLAAGGRTGLTQVRLRAVEAAVQANATPLQVEGRLQHAVDARVRLVLSRFLIYRDNALLAALDSKAAGT